MLTKLLKKYIGLIKRFDCFTDILQPDEKILWQGTPLARHTWGDQGQIEPAGSVGERPVSITARKVGMMLALLFIFFMFLLGAGSFFSGTTEMQQKQDLDTLALGFFLILTGNTVMFGLPFLLRHVSNSMRARQLTFFLTTSRVMVVRRGHALAEIWVRAPVLLSVSLLFIYNVILFIEFYIQGSHQDAVDGAGLSTLFAWVFFLVLMAHVGFIFATFAYVGLRFRCEIIFAAIKDHHGIFVRCFSDNQIKRNDFPVLSKLRKDGVGDIILGQDGHWEDNIDFTDLPWFKINTVDFLSVPIAKRVMAMVEQAVAK